MRIDHESEEFPYLQLAEIVRARIESGEYPAGSRLPPLVDLVAEFDLNKDTVRRGLRELANEGYINIIRGRGTFVRRRLTPPPRQPGGR